MQDYFRKKGAIFIIKFILIPLTLSPENAYLMIYY